MVAAESDKKSTANGHRAGKPNRRLIHRRFAVAEPGNIAAKLSCRVREFAFRMQVNGRPWSTRAYFFVEK